MKKVLGSIHLIFKGGYAYFVCPALNYPLDFFRVLARKVFFSKLTIYIYSQQVRPAFLIFGLLCPDYFFLNFCILPFYFKFMHSPPPKNQMVAPLMISALNGGWTGDNDKVVVAMQWRGRWSKWRGAVVKGAVISVENVGIFLG